MTELSRPLAVTDIGNEPMLFEVVADADELTTLARRFDLYTLESLTGRLAVRRTTARDGSDEVVRVCIDLDATVVQRCIATLEPVATTLSATGSTTHTLPIADFFLFFFFFVHLLATHSQTKKTTP